MSKKAGNFLRDVPPENCFWCCDGRVLKNLYELSQAFNEMTDETFNYHVNEDKNDFATWIKEIIGDKKLVADLVKARNRKVASRKVSERISSLK